MHIKKNLWTQKLSYIWNDRVFSEIALNSSWSICYIFSLSISDDYFTLSLKVLVCGKKKRTILQFGLILILISTGMLCEQDLLCT